MKTLTLRRKSSFKFYRNRSRPPSPKARTTLEFDDPPKNSKQRSKQVDGNALVERILELILEAGLSPKQAREVLDRAKAAIDWGKKEAKKRSVH